MKKKNIKKWSVNSLHYLNLIIIFLLLFPLIFWCIGSSAWAGVDKESIKPKLAKLSIPFIENQGQIKPVLSGAEGTDSVKYYANTFAGTVFVSDKGEIVYSLRAEDRKQNTEDREKKVAAGFNLRNSERKTPNSELIKGWVIKERVLGTESNRQGFKESRIQGIDRAETMVNYFIGNDKEDWRSNVPSYNSVSLGEIYDGIELKLKAYGKNVEKLFVVSPGADASKIALSLDGAESIKVNEAGELELGTGLGPLKFTKPYAYQEINGKRIEVAASFSLRNSELPTPNSGAIYGFEVASYDKNHPLIIDPLLSSTFIGGSNDDIGYSIATDSAGNVYIAGATLSPDYPTTPGAYDITCGTDGNCNGGFYDVIVSKLNNNLTTLFASTFIGGSNHDEGFSIAIAFWPEYVYITGRTESADYPTTPGAYDTTYNGGRDVFVSMLDINLANLLASTYIGGSIDGSTVPGSGDEGGHDITMDYGDSDYVIYVTGWTDSLDYPTTPSAYDTTYNGGISDVFVSKLNTNLSILMASTYIGGTNDDGGNSIATSVAGLGALYVTGQTNSADYPTTPGAYDTTYNGGWDVLVSNLDTNLSILNASTYIGGNTDDIGNSIAHRSSGLNVFVTGQTDSSNYPTTPGAYDTTYNGGWDVLVSKLDIGLTNLLASTFLGGSNDDEGYSLARDSWRRLIVKACGDDIYITGRTMSSDYPFTPLSSASPGTCDRYYNGGWDIIVSSLNDNLANLLASTFFGGLQDDGGYSIATDSSNLFVTGETISPDYLATSGAYDTTCGTDGNCNGGFYDAFVSKFGCSPTLINLTSFTVRGGDGKVILKWTTASEIDNAGFNIWRKTGNKGKFLKINPTLIPAEGSPVQGATYNYIDTHVRNGYWYYYLLEDIDFSGVSTLHGKDACAYSIDPNCIPLRAKPHKMPH